MGDRMPGSRGGDSDGGERRGGSTEKSVGGFSGRFYALTYGVVSIAIMMFNKAVMSSYGFRYATVVTGLQGVFTLTCLWLLKRGGYITFPDVNWETARQVAPLSLVSAFYVMISLAALSGVNLPMFAALRRTTVVLVAFLEYQSFGRVPSRQEGIAMGVMVVGALVAAANDLTMDLWGYVLLLLTNAATALYTVQIKAVREASGLNVFALLFYNNLVTVPVTLVLSWVMGEAEAAFNFPSPSPWFAPALFATITMAFFLNLLTYLSTTTNSPTLQTVVGQLKNGLSVLVSLYIFPDDVNINALWVTGLAIGFAGGVYYAYLQWKQKVAPNSAKSREQPKPGAAALRIPTHNTSHQVIDEERTPKEEDLHAMDIDLDEEHDDR